MSSSNCYFLTCIQVSLETSNMVWDSHLITNIPQFVVIHIVKGFSIVNEAEVDVGFFWIPLLFLWPSICWQNTLFQQHKRWIYTWTSPDSQYQNQTDCILCSQRQRSSIWSAKTRLGADCGSDLQLLIAKSRLKLKKVGKTTRPFRYDLNQIPCDYTVEIMNRCKGLNLVDRLHEELWMKVHNVV